MSAEHVVQLVGVFWQRVVEGHDRTTRYAEDHVHTLPHERFAEDLRACAQVWIGGCAHRAPPANAAVGRDWDSAS